MNPELKPGRSTLDIRDSELLAWLPQFLQTNDSIFPSGSFAHSFGLEGLVQLGQITDPATFGRFLRDQIVPALEHFELPFVRLAYAAAQGRTVVGQASRLPPRASRPRSSSRARRPLKQPGTAAPLARLLALDERYGAMKGSSELRQASSRIGSQRLQMLLALSPHPLLTELEEERRKDAGFQAHAPIIYGVQNALNATPLNAALLGCYYQTLAALVSAALKLIRIGQVAGQSLLAEQLAEAAAVIARSQGIDEADIGWFQPLLDVASMSHETAYSRIFIS